MEATSCLDTWHSSARAPQATTRKARTAAPGVVWRASGRATGAASAWNCHHGGSSSHSQNGLDSPLSASVHSRSGRHSPNVSRVTVPNTALHVGKDIELTIAGTGSMPALPRWLAPPSGRSIAAAGRTTPTRRPRENPVRRKISLNDRDGVKAGQLSRHVGIIIPPRKGELSTPPSRARTCRARFTRHKT